MPISVSNLTKAKRSDDFHLLGESAFRHLIENSSDAVTLVDKRARILYSSPSVKRILGFNASEFKNKNAFDYIHLEDAPFVLRALKELIRNKDKTISAQMRVRHKDGHWVWIEAIGQNLLDNNDIGAVVVNFRDISERKELERRKDEFISVASHELKTPVATIKSFSQIIEKYAQKSKDSVLLSYVTKMETQIDRLAWLINGLLDVSSIQSNKLRLKMENCNIDKLIEETIEEIQPLTDTHKLIFKKRSGKTVKVDKNRINQVLTNFINNAIKYSPKADEVLINTTANDKSVTISIKDYGIGISKADKERIFERFYQVDNRIRESFSGLGLGLYISSEIIKRHGGTIDVESIKGRGSTFKFTLPLK